MDQPKIERLLRLMKLLTGNLSYSITDLSDKLGFVPRDENELLHKFLNLGYSDLFEVKINQIMPEAHPEKQIRVVVRIRQKE